MKEIAFIGVGIMGKPMVRNLMKAGFELHIYARRKEKVLDVVAEGAILHDTIKECVKNRDAVITIVGYPKDVEDVYFTKDHILDCAKPGAYLIDMTTTSPTLAQKIYEEGTKRGFHVLDAPVTGGDVGAIAGTLSVLVGGKAEDYEACRPLFAAMGTNINRQGAPGCGQHAKIVNQIMVAANLAGVCEGLAYAKKAGLDEKTVLKSIATGAAGSKQLELNGLKIIQEDFAPTFFVKHFIKDMKIGIEEAKAAGLNLEILETVLKDYQELAEKGYEDKGTQALIKHYE